MKAFNTIWKLLVRYAVLFIFILAILVIVQGMYNLKAVRNNSSDIKIVVKNSSNTLDQQQTAIDNQGKIIANLTQAVKDLKQDNKQQTEYLQCLMGLNGQPIATNCTNYQYQSATPSTSDTPTKTPPHTQKKQNRRVTSDKPTTKSQPEKKSFIDNLLNKIGVKL